MSSTSRQTVPTKEVDLSHLNFDSTNKVDYMVKEARIRSSEVYVTAGLLLEMEETWGGSFAGIKTITDKATQKVYVFPADPKHQNDVVAVRKSETLSSATFSFFIPMQNLDLKLRKDRQIVVVPVPVTVKGLGTAYCFSLAGVRATKRPRTPEEEASAVEAKHSATAKGASSPSVTAEARPEAEATAAQAKRTKAKSKASKESSGPDASAPVA